MENQATVKVSESWREHMACATLTWLTGLFEAKRKHDDSRKDMIECCENIITKRGDVSNKPFPAWDGPVNTVQSYSIYSSAWNQLIGIIPNAPKTRDIVKVFGSRRSMFHCGMHMMGVVVQSSVTWTGRWYLQTWSRCLISNHLQLLSWTLCWLTEWH